MVWAASAAAEAAEAEAAATVAQYNKTITQIKYCLLLFDKTFQQIIIIIIMILSSRV